MCKIYSARNNPIQTDGMCIASDMYLYPFYYIPAPQPPSVVSGVDLSIRTRRA
jgi:hypothetical protein